MDDTITVSSIFIYFQWGKVSHAAAATNKAYSFPTSFASACYSVLYTLGGTGYAGGNFSMSYMQVTAVSKTSFTVGYVDSSTYYNVGWFVALGQ